MTDGDLTRSEEQQYRDAVKLHAEELLELEAQDPNAMRADTLSEVCDGSRWATCNPYMRIVLRWGGMDEVGLHGCWFAMSETLAEMGEPFTLEGIAHYVFREDVRWMADRMARGAQA